jgi:DNA-binding IclR family transcriptional regulator
MGRRSNAPAATHALAVLKALAAAPGPLPAAALAQRLGLPRSTTYHLLDAMVAEGFVVHLPEERRWGLGVATFEVGSAYLRHEPLERLARPLLSRLVHDTDETAQLGILHGRETLYLLKDHPRRSVPVVSDVGVRLPAHLTASGQAILAYLPRAQIRALFPSRASFVDRTGRGPRSLTEVQAELSVVRRRGWATEDGYVTEGFASVAATAFDHMGGPVAAVTLTFQRETHAEAEWPALAALAQRAARELTGRLGGHPPEPG